MRRALVIAPFVALGCSSAEPPVTFEEGSGTGRSSDGAEGSAASELPSMEGARVPYPAPPYGTRRGAVIENLRFLGWENPAAVGYDESALEPVELASYYDPQGDSGVSFIVMTSTAVWCSVCRAEYEDFRSGRVAQYQEQGVEFVGVLFEDRDYRPAQPEDLATWAELYDVEFNFLLDPSFKLGAYFDRMATPMTMVVDTRTMEIAWMGVGWALEGPESVWGVLDEALAAR